VAVMAQGSITNRFPANYRVDVMDLSSCMLSMWKRLPGSLDASSSGLTMDGMPLLPASESLTSLASAMSTLSVSSDAASKDKGKSKNAPGTPKAGSSKAIECFPVMDPGNTFDLYTRQSSTDFAQAVAAFQPRPAPSAAAAGVSSNTAPATVPNKKGPRPPSTPNPASSGTADGVAVSGAGGAIDRALQTLLAHYEHRVFGLVRDNPVAPAATGLAPWLTALQTVVTKHAFRAPVITMPPPVAGAKPARAPFSERDLRSLMRHWRRVVSAALRRETILPKTVVASL